MNHALRNDEFDRLLSGAFGLLGDENFTAHKPASEKRSRFARARAKRRKGSRKPRRARSSIKSRSPKRAALAFERRELWDEAIALYRSVLESDETLLFAQTGLERAQARAGLDAKLGNLIDNPSLLLGDVVLNDARKLLESRGRGNAARPAARSQIVAARPARRAGVAAGRRASHFGSADERDVVSGRLARRVRDA